jgi:hypothetical protein
MSSFRHEEIYQSDVASKIEEEPAETGSPDHRLDASPAGYCSVGWSPPAPASASPTEDHCVRERGRLRSENHKTEVRQLHFVSIEGFTPQN